MYQLKQKIVFLTALCAFTLLVIPLVSHAVVHAANDPKGTCFVTDPSGTKVRACTASDKQTIKDNGKTFQASKCYGITSTTSTTNVAVTSCNGKPKVGTQTCTDAKGKQSTCVSCSDGSLVADTSQCPESDVSGSSGDPAATSDADCGTVAKCDLVSKYLNPFINLMAALVGVAVTISIVVGGIRYASSAGDPQAAAAGKARIRNSIIALITFIFLYAILNFLIPGGLL